MYPADSQLDGPQQLFVFSAESASGHIVGLKLSGDNIQVWLILQFKYGRWLRWKVEFDKTLHPERLFEFKIVW